MGKRVHKATQHCFNTIILPNCQYIHNVAGIQIYRGVWLKLVHRIAKYWFWYTKISTRIICTFFELIDHDFELVCKRENHKNNTATKSNFKTNGRRREFKGMII